ncbi:DUF2140 family protein [Macrococcus hajekii]|uniref:DUF2140 family protein n=1 Tax=Macrococcus hajekii TaxID=198482 RepID=A0A4R6BMI3_9STAP|nr:DUF2140 family protein [Macrococcus hajekii]TDM03033.1 DUF2140 family protein [Macrococcus hajekii]GGB06036.1 hypothetical protein GCM10007190_12560 [Macrococcus hajekii]
MRLNLKSFGWVLFGLLAIVNLAIAIWVVSVLNTEPETFNVKDTSSPGQIILPSSMVKGAIEGKSTKDMQLELKGKQLVIEQQSSLMGLKIKTNILTTPTVIGDNKLRLNINDVEIAGLKLPMKQKLNLIKKFGQLPDGVKLDVGKKCFYYQLDPIKFGDSTLILTDIDAEGWHFNIR